MEGCSGFNVSCKKYLEKLLDNDKVLMITIDGDQYIIFRGITLPFMFCDGISSGNLNLLSKKWSYFSEEIGSEFFKPNGLRQLLDKVKNLSNVSECDDTVLNIKVCHSKEIMNDLDVDYIIETLERAINTDLEFMDIDIDFDKSTEDEIDLAFQNEYKNIKEEYLSKFAKYFSCVDEDKINIIKNKINSLLY